MQRLPGPVREALVREIAERASGPYDGGLDDALQDWGQSIVTMRYPYDLDRGMSDEARLERGQKWIRADAPLGEAQFRFHPILLGATIQTLQRLTAPVLCKDYRLDLEPSPYEPALPAPDAGGNGGGKGRRD